MKNIISLFKYYICNMKHIQYDDGLVSKGKYQQQQHKEYSELFSIVKISTVFTASKFIFSDIRNLL